MEDKPLAIIKLVLLSFIALLLTGILIVLLIDPKNNINFLKFSSKSELIYQKEITDPIKKIQVTTKASDIQIENSNSDKISVKFYGEKEDKELNLTSDNEVLKIDEEETYFCVGICNFVEHKIIISIPKDIDYELALQTTSGDVYVPDISLTNISIKSVSGDIGMINADKAKLETTSGDIEVHNVSDLTVKTVSGEVDVNQIKRSCNIKTTSGDIDIELLEITHNSKISTISGDVEISSNVGSYVKTKTVSGEVDIQNNDRYAKTELVVTTTSGDIEVKN